MNIISGRWAGAFVLLASILICGNAFALGSDYPADQPVTGTSEWPAGMEKLVNSTNRVHGFFVNSEDVFFFSGSATNFSSFLKSYSELKNIEAHVLILHEGAGEAKSPWGTPGKPCDWKLEGCPKGWRNLAELSKKGEKSIDALRKAGQEKGYFLEVHFWTGGQIATNQVAIPRNIEVRKGK